MNNADNVDIPTPADFDAAQREDENECRADEARYAELGAKQQLSQKEELEFSELERKLWPSPSATVDFEDHLVRETLGTNLIHQALHKPGVLKAKTRNCWAKLKRPQPDTPEQRQDALHLLFHRFALEIAAKDDAMDALACQWLKDRTQTMRSFGAFIDACFAIRVNVGRIDACDVTREVLESEPEAHALANQPNGLNLAGARQDVQKDLVPGTDNVKTADRRAQRALAAACKWQVGQEREASRAKS